MPDGCLNCRLLLTFICILNFLISITLKINQTWAHISWFLIFIPVWIFNLISLCLIGYLILFKKWLKLGRLRLRIFCYLISLLSSCAFEILLCFKLQYNHKMQNWIVFLPLWIFIAFILSIVAQRMYKICMATTDKNI